MRGKKKEGTSKALKNRNSAQKVGEELEAAVEALRDSPTNNPNDQSNPNDSSYQSSLYTETETTAEGPIDGKQRLFFVDETESKP